MDNAEYDLDEMQPIIDEFMIETREIIDALNANLVKLEKDPGNPDLLSEIFRGTHTIKGTSGFLGFKELMRLTHRLEDVLNKLRKGEIRVTPGITDVLLDAVDAVKSVLQDIVDKNQGATDISIVLNALSNIYKGKPRTTIRPARSRGSKFAKMQAISNTPAATDAERTHAQTAGPARNHKRELLKKSDSTIRVGVDRLDSVVNMIGELVLGRNALMQSCTMLQAAHAGDKSIEQLGRAASQINFITGELHMAIMKMRMLPVGNVFNKFPRVVRDLSRDLHKKIDLVIVGEETELDKSVLEIISDPLVHLIRNAIDHGIEAPEERRKLGKPEKGIIRLSSYREGNNIVIEVTDDGRGMNLNSIKIKALEKNLVTPEELGKLTKKEILSFIFQPGFSTAKKTTNISGRGVGMDVVRNNVEKLRGTIDIGGEEGRGSMITIRLPLTLAIVQGLLTGSGRDIFVIPLTSVIEAVAIDHSDIRYINQKPVVRLHDSILPIVELTDVLYGRRPQRTGRIKIVVVGLAEKRLGLIVDSLIGQEEVVIRSLGNYLSQTPGVAGATIMGDGRVRLVIDLPGLFERVAKNSHETG